MIDWDKLNYIKYLNYEFTQDKIKSGSLLLNQDLTCASLAINTLSPVVECDDVGILNFERDTPLYYYRAGRLRGVFYVQDIERIGPIRYQITAQSTIALLDRGRHMGGIYTGQEAGEVLPDIAGSVPIIIKTNLLHQKLYGWLPIASPRANMAQALFALGASIRTELDGYLHVASLWDGLSGVILPDDTYRQGGAVRARGKITQVAVTEHQYLEGGPLTTLFEGAAQQGYEVVFDDPMYDLQATGFSILAQGANYAVLGAGTGTLTGREYIHNTRMVTRSIQTAPDPNVKSFPDATLVSLVNSASVADRLVNYYQHRQTVEEPVIYRGNNCGDLLQLPDPFDNIQVTACLESAEVNLSATLKAQGKALIGFVPIKFSDYSIIETSQIITTSQTIQLPEDTKYIRAVLIGGGDGGEAGHDGSPGGNGTGALIPSNTTGTQTGTVGLGGPGGEAGLAGSGGKFLDVEIPADGVTSLVINIGIGGSAGTISGTAGNRTTTQPTSGSPTTIHANGKVYSSSNGSASPDGYIDILTGQNFAKSGKNGISGGKGGNGYPYNGPVQGDYDGESVMEYSGGIGAKNSNVYIENDDIESATTAAGGGGAAYGENGVSTQSGVNPGNGARGGNAANPAQTNDSPGSGGNGGHGGGGSGGGGCGAVTVRKKVSGSVVAPGGKGGVPGLASSGTNGASGCVILYLSAEKKQPDGEFRDKYGRPIIEKELRRFVV